MNLLLKQLLLFFLVSLLFLPIQAEVFRLHDIQVEGLHEFQDQAAAIANAEAIFVGGGNTFVLLTQLSRAMSLLQ